MRWHFLDSLPVKFSIFWFNILSPREFWETINRIRLIATTSAVVYL